MEFKVGDWVMTLDGVRQIDAITPSGQIKIGIDRYKQNKWGDYSRIGSLIYGNKLRHATETEISARKQEIEAQIEHDRIQKARAKMARDFMRSFDWDTVPDVAVIYLAEGRGFKGYEAAMQAGE